MEAQQDLVDLLLAVALAGLEAAGNVAQHGFELLLLCRDGLEAAIGLQVIVDHLAVEGVQVHACRDRGHLVTREDALHVAGERRLLELVDAVIPFRTGGDQPHLG